MAEVVVALTDLLIAPATTFQNEKRMGEELAALNSLALRATCRERGLLSKGIKADLLVRLSSPEELRPLPQLHDANAEGDGGDPGEGLQKNDHMLSMQCRDGTRA
jgi:hypothetical protein